MPGPHGLDSRPHSPQTRTDTLRKSVGNLKRIPIMVAIHNMNKLLDCAPVNGQCIDWL